MHTVLLAVLDLVSGSHYQCRYRSAATTNQSKALEKVIQYDDGRQYAALQFLDTHRHNTNLGPHNLVHVWHAHSL
jgi:hypothetical protein